MQNMDKEKLRAFEQKMHDEGADGFADGPRPWETWDESGAQASNGRHIWEGKARRIYKNTRVQRSLGDRVLSGLAMTAIATMVVGIAGVYLTEEQPRTVAWTAIKPTPIPLPGQGDSADTQRLPARLERSAPVIAKLEALPPPAAGSAPLTAETPAAATDTANQWQTMAERDSKVTDTGGPLPASEAASLAATGPATGPEPAPGDSGSDIEIFAAPTALLLTSVATSSQADNDESGLELEPELSLEIATAPSVESETDEAVVVASQATAGPDVAVGRVTGNTTSQPETSAETGATTAKVASNTRQSQGTISRFDATADHSDSKPAIAAEEIPLQPTASPAAMPDDSIGSIEADPIAIPADVLPAADTATVQKTQDESTASEAGESTTLAMTEPPPAAAPVEAVTPAAAPAGDWVVNLASYNHEAMARRKLGEFQAKGVTAEIETTTIKDRQMYRIRVTGFENSRAARASIGSLEKTLGLKGVWISRR